jgi:hypothetical protein
VRLRGALGGCVCGLLLFGLASCGGGGQAGTSKSAASTAVGASPASTTAGASTANKNLPKLPNKPATLSALTVYSIYQQGGGALTQDYHRMNGAQRAAIASINQHGGFAKTLGVPGV